MRKPDTNLETKTECRIFPVGKRRDGGTKYWCMEHKADATAKYGKRGVKCRYADVSQIKQNEILDLDINLFPGGVALWGAVPPVYDTTELPIDRGIHVHARRSPEKQKVVDKTYRQVRLVGTSGDATVSELDAIYYMVSSVFGFKVKTINCSKCGYPHLDKDWFSVHPHQSHLCAGCGRNFRDSEIAIGNPVASIQKFFGGRDIEVVRSTKKLKICQSDYPSGIRIWASNPAIFWTSINPQKSGIHVHGYKKGDRFPTIDDTFDHVEVDGVVLNEVQMRLFMAQNALPHLAGRIKPISCLNCGSVKCDKGDSAFNPTHLGNCLDCGGRLTSDTRLRKLIANPFSLELKKLSQYGVREPRVHDLELIPETI